MKTSPRQFAGESVRHLKGRMVSPIRAKATHPMVAYALLAVGALTVEPAGLYAQPAEAEQQVSREYAIKAAYLYQFGRYVQWPGTAFGDSEAPFVIGVLGTDPFGGVLDEIARSKKAEGRTIVVRRFASMTDYASCHILFVPSTTTAAQQAEAIKRAQGSPLLLVGETPRFALQGGTVNFYLEENRIRFEINVEAAKRQQLKISSKLLNLAKIVAPAGPGQSGSSNDRPTPWAGLFMPVCHSTPQGNQCFVVASCTASAKQWHIAEERLGGIGNSPWVLSRLVASGAGVRKQQTTT